jgi:hypothetical protein
VFGPPQFGPRRMPMLSGPMPAGVLAPFRIRPLPMWGAARMLQYHRESCLRRNMYNGFLAAGFLLTFPLVPVPPLALTTKQAK